MSVLGAEFILLFLDDPDITEVFFAVACEIGFVTPYNIENASPPNIDLFLEQNTNSLAPVNMCASPRIHVLPLSTVSADTMFVERQGKLSIFSCYYCLQ